MKKDLKHQLGTYICQTRPCWTLWNTVSRDNYIVTARSHNKLSNIEFGLKITH